MKFPYTVKSEGKQTATIMATGAFDAGLKYVKEFSPDHRNVMPAKLVSTSGYNTWKQEALGIDDAIFLFISEAF